MVACHQSWLLEGHQPSSGASHAFRGRIETFPTLDLRRFDGPASQRSHFLEDLRNAASNAGFFYLVGHRIEDALIRNVLKVSRRFFALPGEDKRAIELVSSPHFCGYNRAGFAHTRGQPDWREQVDIGPERPALSFNRDAPPWPRGQGPNHWVSVFWLGVIALSANMLTSERARVAQ